MNGRVLEELVFFEGHESSFVLYDALKKKITDFFPDTNIQFKKTQINYKNRHIYACVSFQRVLKKSELPEPYIVLTLGMPYPLESKRVAVKTEPYPGRWTTHIVVGTVDEIDDELLAWVSDAYAFADVK